MKIIRFLLTICKLRNTLPKMNLILEAARDAARIHAGQTRRNGEPYIRHPNRVAGRVANLPESSEQMVEAAYLHDAFEDGANAEELKQDILAKYGPMVVRIIEDLTNPSHGTKGPRHERKQIDRRHLMIARKDSKIIKLIDRADNLQESVSDIQKGVETRLDFAALYADESQLLLDEVLKGTHPELEGELQSSIVVLKAVITLRGQQITAKLNEHKRTESQRSLSTTLPG